MRLASGVLEITADDPAASSCWMLCLLCGYESQALELKNLRHLRHGLFLNTGLPRSADEARALAWWRQWFRLSLPYRVDPVYRDTNRRAAVGDPAQERIAEALFERFRMGAGRIPDIEFAHAALSPNLRPRLIQRINGVEHG